MEIKATMLLRAEEAKNEQDRTQAQLYIKQIDAIMAQEKHQIEMLRGMSETINVDNDYIHFYKPKLFFRHKIVIICTQNMNILIRDNNIFLYL